MPENILGSVLPHKKEGEPYTCIHCKRKFDSYKGLTAHLAGCPERNLKRIFDVGGYRFVLFMNPLHRVIRGLRDLQKKIRGQYPDEERIFMGAIICLSSMGYVKEYQISKIDADSKANA